MAASMQPVLSCLVLFMLRFTLSAPAFFGDFEITNLFVNSPFQVYPTSTVNSSVSFDFADQGTPDCEPVSCYVEWQVGLQPPSDYSINFCTNSSYSLNFPAGSYSGVANFTIHLSHEYVDNSIGGIVRKYGNLDLYYPDTSNYECDMEDAYCESCDTLIAVVTGAIAKN